MRFIWPILVVLAGCGPGSGVTASSFASDSCTPEAASVDAIELWQHGRELHVGDPAPTVSGGQGLPMADFEVRIEGVVRSCVSVIADVGYVHESGGLKVADGFQGVKLFMGPVDPSNGFTIDVTIERHHAHADIRGGRVTEIR